MAVEKILLVDDDKDTVNFLQNGLEREGFAVLTAFNGKEAKAVILKDKPDMIIVDLMMPVLDGWQLLKWLRQEAELTIPTVIVSAKDELDDLQQGASLADTYLVKPVTIDDVLRAIRVVSALEIEKK